MKSAWTFAAIGEAATGLALLIVPSFVGQLLLGEQLTGVAVPVARVAGIALIALCTKLGRGQDADPRAADEDAFAQKLAERETETAVDINTIAPASDGNNDEQR